MVQGSSLPSSFSIFSILSAISFCSMINCVRGVLRGGKKAVEINRIKNMKFPEIPIYSILLISMATSDMPLAFDSGNLKNTERSTDISTPSEKMHSKGIVSAENRLGPRDHPLKKLGSCKVGLGIILRSPIEEMFFGQKVKVECPKPLGPSAEMVTTNNSGDAVPVHGGNCSYNIHHEWPCVFAQNQGPDSVISRSSLTKGSKQFTICTKHRNAGFLSLEEIEKSDNYTRKINHLPCLKVTHMYNYCVLEFPQSQASDDNFTNQNPLYPPRVHNLRRWSVLSSNENFLKNCETCDKPIEGHDAYIYRGESSFCSLECRYWKVKAERDFEKVTRMVPTARSSSSKKKSMFYVGAKPPAGE